MDSQKIFKAAGVAILAMLAVLASIGTAPFGVPLACALLGQGKPNLAAPYNAIFHEGGSAYWNLAFTTVTDTTQLLPLFTWFASVASGIALFAMYRHYAKPARVAEDGSLLGSVSVIKGWGSLRRKNDYWNGKGQPNDAGLVLSASKRGYLYDASIPHYLVVGKTGSGKSQLVMLESIHLCMAAGANLLVTGKPELVELTGDKATELGYKRVIFDLQGYPGASGFNPIDLVASYVEEGNIGEAQRAARQVASDLIPLGGETNTYFPKAARSCLTSIILLVACSDAPRKAKNMASVADIIAAGTAGAGKDPSAPLKDYIRSLGPSHPAFAPAGDFLSDGGLTTAGKNVISTLKEAVGIFNDESIRAITAQSSLSMDELFDGKAVAYFHLLEDGDPYQVIYAAFFNQWWRVAQAKAAQNGGRLSRKTIILGDEWGNMGRVECTPLIATLGRSMDIRANFFVQNIKQLNAYDKPGDNGAGKAKIIGSIGGKVALSLADPEDFALFTKLAGKRTVRTNATSQQRQGSSRSGSSESFNETADDVIHEWEWQNRIAVRDGSIVIKGGENSAPGREGVFETPLTLASKTPAGDFFGLGTQEEEALKKQAFRARAEALASEESEISTWMPDFETTKAPETSQAEVLDDEFAAWD